MEMESNLMHGYKQAFEMAARLLETKDPGKISQNTLCPYDGNGGFFNVRFLGAEHRVSFPDGKASRPDGKEVTATENVLLLHYLLNAVNVPPAGEMISFREVRGGGANYYPTFYKRAILPLQKTFEKNPDGLKAAALKLGGKVQDCGDAGVSLYVFPLLPVTYAVWAGDEEIPGSAAILFDRSVNSILPCEDVVLTASFGTYALIRQAAMDAAPKG